MRCSVLLKSNNMKTIFKTLLCTAMAAALTLSCETPETPETPENPETPVDSDLMLFSYYTGDFYENGTANVYINFLKGDITSDEEGNLYGTGFVTCLDFCASPVTTEDTDHLHLADFAGTYTLGSDNAAGQISGDVDDSYVYVLENGEPKYDTKVYDEVTLVISPSDKGVKVSVNATVGGEPFSFTYEGTDYIVSQAEESLSSNIPEDLNFDSAVGAAVVNLGDMIEDGTTNTWVIILGDKDYDFYSDFGYGQSMLLYLNTAPGSEVLPTDHYEGFINPFEAEELTVGSLFSGFIDYGQYFGCWYLHTSKNIEGTFVDGYVDVEQKGEVYKISGELLDAYGKKVTFSYEGDLMYYEFVEEEAYSTRSSKESGFSKYAKKNPFSCKK